VRTYRIGVPTLAQERLECGRDAQWRRLVEVEAGHSLVQGVEEPTPTQQRRRLAERGRLDRGETEVLVGRADETRAVRVQPSQVFVIDRSEHRDVRGSDRTKVGFLWTSAHDDQLMPTEPLHRADDRVDVLVRDEPRDAQHEPRIERADRRLRPVDVDGVRRWDDLGVDAIRGSDAIADDGRVREVPMRTGGSREIPPTESVLEQRQAHARDAAPTGLVSVGLIEPTSRVVAVDDLATVGLDAVRPSARTAHHHVGRDAHPREAAREERQRGAVVAAQRVHVVERARTDRQVCELRERA
jgi:hypothetical protein